MQAAWLLLHLNCGATVGAGLGPVLCLCLLNVGRARWLFLHLEGGAAVLVPLPPPFPLFFPPAPQALDLPGMGF